jgi:hypothetical protein
VGTCWRGKVNEVEWIRLMVFIYLYKI